MSSARDKLNPTPNDHGQKTVSDEYAAILIREYDVPKLAIYNQHNMDSWVESDVAFRRSDMR